MTKEELAEHIETILTATLGNHLVGSNVFRVGEQVYVDDLYIEVMDREF